MRNINVHRPRSLFDRHALRVGRGAALVIALFVSFALATTTTTAVTSMPERHSIVVQDAETLYNDRCAVCHGVVGEAGRPYPRWLGDTFAVYTMSEDELVVFLRQTMPLDGPGSLTDDEYRSLATFLRRVTLNR